MLSRVGLNVNPYLNPYEERPMSPMVFPLSHRERAESHGTIGRASGMRYQPSSVGRIRAQIRRDCPCFAFV
jgi:hypothetical protein